MDRKSMMRAMAGINRPVIGEYDSGAAARCSNGTFVGVRDGAVVAYRGIPFAMPPVGGLRWKNPVPAEDRDGVYEAFYFGKSPIQTEWPSEAGSYYPQGEDCLTLNVWASAAGPAEGRTVMVFFHGGSYGWGAASDPIYDGHNLAEKFPDIVLVTAEYRTGIMGFIDFSSVPGGEDFKTSGNLGLLDQVCALRWVRKNIRAFGGDPENVTIFGESAGAGSVSLLPLIAGTEGLFRRVIAQSGSVALTSSREECRNLTRRLLKLTGCGNMDELMALDEAALMQANVKLNYYNNFPERDGIVLPVDLYGAWERKALKDIDLLIGTNADESRYWIREMGYYVRIIPGFALYKHGGRVMFENNLARLSDREKSSVKSFMAAQKGRMVWRITEFNNEVLFRLPAAEQAVRHTRSGGRSYVYYWTMPCADVQFGACHAIELSYVFSNPQETIYTGGLYDEKLAETVQEMWVRFARTGDPATPEYPWEPYTPHSRMTMLLGKSIHMESDLMGEQRKWLHPLLRHYFNGCFAQLDLNVPHVRKAAGLLAALAMIVIVLLILFLR